MSHITAIRKYVVGAVLSGLLVLGPIYLAVLLLLQATTALIGIVRPATNLFRLPDWVPADKILSLLLMLLVCFLVGLWVRTRMGQSTLGSIENRLLQKMPGYTSMRSLAHRLLEDSYDRAWKPALAEIEEALVPAFIIEELEDGRFTVFVPSVPTPLAGAVYILGPDRVHPVNVPFTQAIRVVSQWGQGAKDLVAAMESRAAPLRTLPLRVP